MKRGVRGGGGGVETSPAPSFSTRPDRFALRTFFSALPPPLCRPLQRADIIMGIDEAQRLRNDAKGLDALDAGRRRRGRRR